MSTRSLRNRVSSRLSSPSLAADAELAGQPGDNDGDETGDGGPHDWVEPPVRRLPPSFQDHKGLERVGVLELQQPLGEPPSQKLLQRLKLTYKGPSSRATPLQTEEGLTPSVESERPDFPSPREAERLSEPPQQDGTRDDFMAVSTPPRGRPAKRDLEEMRHSVYPPDVTPSPVQSTFSPTARDAFPPKPISIQEHLRQDRVSAYIDKAIEEAERSGDLGLVPGLRKVRDTAFRKRDLWLVVDAIAHQSPTEEQLSIFKRFIKKGVKRHRRSTGLSGSSVLPFPGNSVRSRGFRGGVLDISYAVPSPGAPAPALNQAPTFTSPFRPRFSPPRFQPPQVPQSPVHLSPSSKRGTMNSASKRSPGQQASSGTLRRRRSRSNSSSSSLSSAKSIPEEFGPDPTEGESEAAIADERPESKDPKDARDQRQGPERHPAKLRSAANSIPPSKHPFHSFPDVAKIAAKKLKKSRDEVDYDPADVEKRRKRYLAESFQDYNSVSYTQINERHHVPYLDAEYPATTSETRVPPPVLHGHPVKAAQGKLDASFGSQSLPDKSLPNGTSRKRNYDEMDEDDLDLSSRSPSPVPSFAPPPPLGVRMSRAGTPRAAKVPAINKARKSARVMVSPNKPKNGGITAGISRVGPSRDSGMGNGPDSGAEDNDEFCASCGGEGKLLCCDGCSNSLHHCCLEPPLDPDQEVEGEWYCPQCQAKRTKNVSQSRGILGKVIGRVQDIIPKAFALPMEIRDYFEGVRTGEGGEYEEFGQARTVPGLKMNRAGFFEEPNYKEQRDSKGKLITCYRCGQTANGRDLVPCDFCEHRFHLDCLDPPLAVPPRRRIGDKVNATWRCPLHVEQDLAGIGRQAEAAPGDLGRRPRPRKPKKGKPVDVSMPRGHMNNGVIEVDLMKDDLPEIKEIEMNGGVFRLPEMGIRLDFIDRVKKSWFEDESFAILAGRPPKMKERAYHATGTPMQHQPDHLVFKMKEPDFFTGSQAVAVAATAKANAEMRRKTFAEQQAILNLVAMAQNTPGYSGDAIADLTNQLISDAPGHVDQAIQRSEKEQLHQLQGIINRRLQILDGVDLPPALTYPTPAPAAPGYTPLKPKPVNYYQPIQPYPSAPQMQPFTPAPASNGYRPQPQQQHSYQQPSYQPTPQTQLDPAIDPRLFGNGDFGQDEDADADVEMDGP